MTLFLCVRACVSLRLLKLHLRERGAVYFACFASIYHSYAPCCACMHAMGKSPIQSDNQRVANQVTLAPVAIITTSIITGRRSS